MKLNQKQIEQLKDRVDSYRIEIEHQQREYANQLKSVATENERLKEQLRQQERHWRDALFAKQTTPTSMRRIDVDDDSSDDDKDDDDEDEDERGSMPDNLFKSSRQFMPQLVNVDSTQTTPMSARRSEQKMMKMHSMLVSSSSSEHRPDVGVQTTVRSTRSATNKSSGHGASSAVTIPSVESAASSSQTFLIERDDHVGSTATNRQTRDSSVTADIAKAQPKYVTRYSSPIPQVTIFLGCSLTNLSAFCYILGFVFSKAGL